MTKVLIYTVVWNLVHVFCIKERTIIKVWQLVMSTLCCVLTYG